MKTMQSERDWRLQGSDRRCSQPALNGRVCVCLPALGGLEEWVTTATLIREKCMAVFGVTWTEEG